MGVYSLEAGGRVRPLSKIKIKIPQLSKGQYREVERKDMVIHSKDKHCLINLPENELWRIDIERLNKDFGIVLKIDDRAFLLKNHETYSDAEITLRRIFDKISIGPKVIDV